MLVPHQPYVFTPDGTLQTDSDFYSRGWGLPVDNQHDYDGYRNQIAFINQRILAVLQTIISQSDTPPIILLQSDHGISPYRNANLGAYYLPGGGASSLYSHFTSVNTFRVVFNTYFGGQYALLPDMAYESTSLEMLYDLTPYVEIQPACAP